MPCFLIHYYYQSINQSINRFIQGTLIQIYTRYTIEKNRKNVSRSLQENLEVSPLVRTLNKNNKDISTIG